MSAWYSHGPFSCDHRASGWINILIARYLQTKWPIRCPRSKYIWSEVICLRLYVCVLAPYSLRWSGEVIPRLSHAADSYRYDCAIGYIVTWTGSRPTPTAYGFKLSVYATSILRDLANDMPYLNETILRPNPQQPRWSGRIAPAVGLCPMIAKTSAPPWIHSMPSKSRKSRRLG